MSIRSLIEINHDFTWRMDDGFLPALQRYLASGSEHDGDALRLLYGVTIISQRHHSADYVVKAPKGGFPARYIEKDAA